ncbi:hypothetical protein NIES2135_61150 (plasmid) [Leptolyngbya boryana NIES-2135]|uniref:Uncharacterized protein n=2 Tax=Leptolyngbya TaxID=47251 RepID=A0A1Z4JRF2_LEPBY|nr:hypothetical protein [Leptolyngbya boryana]ULP33432.1 hypothetical protein MCP04_30345 [Leptolyngbya boryana IU 594]BAY59238.1 hypothetical protein NIES2135_61150 [Leptolyngbya boryana NIES-2135]
MEKANLHDTVMPLLEAMHQEFKELSKKKPDSVLSLTKVKTVNRLLNSCRKILESEQSIQFLDTLDEDNIPQNSDVVLTLSQYVAAMAQFKSSHYGWDGVKERWFTED